MCQLSSEAQCRRVLDAVACAVQVEAEMQTVFEGGDAEAPPTMYAQPPPAVDVESQTLLPPAPPPPTADMRPFTFMYEFVGRAFGLR